MIPADDGRPTPARLPRHARRSQLLDVAQELFTTEGYHHVSMDDIAARANVSKPVLYRHFPSKLDLYLAIVDARGAELLATVDDALRALGPAADGPTRAAAVVSAHLTFVRAAGEASALLFESDVAHDPEVRGRVESASRAAAERIASAMAGATDVETGRLLAAGLVALAEGAAIHAMRNPGAVAGDRAGEAVALLVRGGLDGLAGPDHTPPTT